MLFDYLRVLDCLHYIENHESVYSYTRTVYDYEIDLHLTGNRQVTVNGKTYEIEADTCTFRKPGDIVTGTGLVLNAFCLTFDLSDDEREMPFLSRKYSKPVRRISANPLISSIPPVFKVENRNAVYQLYEELAYLCICGTDAEDYDRRKAVSEKLLLLLASESISLPHVSGVTRPEMIEARSFILMNFAKDIQIKILAKDFGYSTEHFIRMFKRGMGCTPAEYLIQVRMENAGHLLKITNTPISEVAMMSGYTSFSFFSQTFKRYYGMTPSEFRRSSAESIS